ncbi:nuclear transport factor 2 family protein [Streptomyces roseoverticillatus]|uniref:nuclear transport factor 2 family protein n=1 Tax=Streptomyces roseoverticillatus TaxID=66429 RepID=UPI001F2944C1|nr:nuclear transport factor 2 family protein [Streptomyces roseoverticillatus]MCF3103199.1 nuclear transport factor 2 family protein [Streptomyces roseoverticillatus]
MHTDQPQDIAPDALPEVITRYLAAHRDHDTATALSAFHSDATVTDEGKTHRGAPAIETWLNRSSSEYTYTIELTSAQKVDTDHYVATHHLEGNFPGGVVDLHYRFTLDGGLIENLVIEP